MQTILKLFVIIAVFVTTNAVNEGDESLMKILAKERKEMREIFQRENERLAEEDQKLQRQNDQLLQRLEKQDEKLTKQAEEIVKQREENAKQNQMQQQQQQVIAKLHDQNRKLNQKLRHAELESKKAARQNDQREKLNMKKFIQTELQNSIISKGRNDSLELELKKFIKAEINDFLMTEKVCVGGTIYADQTGWEMRQTVNFGYTFPREPTVVASASLCYRGDNCGAMVSTVTNSSAVILTYSSHGSPSMYASWMACL